MCPLLLWPQSWILWTADGRWHWEEPPESLRHKHKTAAEPHPLDKITDFTQNVVQLSGVWWRGGGGVTVGTSGCFGCELRIEIERVVRSSCSRFEGRVELSAEEFLQGTGNVRKPRHSVRHKTIQVQLIEWRHWHSSRWCWRTDASWSPPRRLVQLLQINTTSAVSPVFSLKKT